MAHNQQIPLNVRENGKNQDKKGKIPEPNLPSIRVTMIRMGRIGIVVSRTVLLLTKGSINFLIIRSQVGKELSLFTSALSVPSKATMLIVATIRC